MYRQTNILGVFLLLQILATGFVLLVFSQHLFFENIPETVLTIFGVFHQIFIIPAVILTLVCFMFSSIQLLARKDYSKYSLLLFSISLVTILLMTFATIYDF